MSASVGSTSCSSLQYGLYALQMSPHCVLPAACVHYLSAQLHTAAHQASKQAMVNQLAGQLTSCWLNAEHAGHDLRGHTNEVHASELRRRQEHGVATDRALTDATNTVQDTTARGKQQAAAGADHRFVRRHILVYYC